MKFGKWDIIRSYLFGRILTTLSSETNPYLEVSLINNKLVLNARHINYSYGGLHKVFQKAFKEINISSRIIQDVLILGFGAGSIAEILIEEHQLKCRITGVEKDPEVIRLAEEYFNTGRFKTLDILQEDACKFFKTNNRRFDLVIIDVYIDHNVPKCCETHEFIRDAGKALNPGGLVVFNKMIYNKDAAASGKRLIKVFENSFENSNVIEIHERIMNWIIVGENPFAPDNSRFVNINS